jgi:hypothetical protein
VRREHDDELRHTRDDGAGQCHRRRGDARRIAAGLLTRVGQFRAKTRRSLAV